MNICFSLIKIVNKNYTYLSLHDRSNLVRDTQLPSTKLPFITVGTAHVRQATYKAHANQCKLSPCKTDKFITLYPKNA